MNKHLTDPVSTHRKGPRAEILVALVYGWIPIIVALLIYSYLQKSFTEVLSFQLKDDWCPVPGGGIGVHCFGDIGLPYMKGNFAEIYVPGNLAATGTPLTLLIFELFRSFPYRISVLIFILLIFASSLAVTLWGAQRLSTLERAVVAVFVGVGSYGVLTAVDRGNHVALLLIPALWFVISIARGKWMQAAIALSIIAALKFWGIIFISALLARKRYLAAFVALLITGALFFVPLLYFKGGMIEKVNLTAKAISTSKYSDKVAPYSIGFSDFLRRAYCLAKTGTWCNTSYPNSRLPLSSIWPPILAGALFVWTILIQVRLRRYKSLTFSAVLCLSFTAVPGAGPYNAVFAVLILAVYLRWAESDLSAAFETSPLEGRQVQIALRVLAVALILTLLPLPLGFISTFPLAASNGFTPPVFRVQYWLIPMAWIAYVRTTTGLAVSTFLSKEQTSDLNK